MAFHYLELPRPRSFLQKMSLLTGAEIITFLHVINKVSGLYGLLALLTGAHLSGLQLSMYLYSTCILFTTVYLYRHIRLQSPFQVLLLAHLYALDSVVNALYTAFFGVAWFYVLAAHPNESSAPGAGGITENAGFTSPKYNVSSVEVVAEPASGGQNAVAMGQGTLDGSAGLSGAVFQSASIMSIALISGFWVLKVYFVFVMLAYARQCLRQHIAANASSAAWYTSNDASETSQGLAENPFADGKEEGSGWRGKIGRTMLSGAPQYWLGADENENWMRGVGGKFRKNLGTPGTPGTPGAQLALPGVNERERRRRSGTGPPVPPREMLRPNVMADLQEVR